MKNAHLRFGWLNYYKRTEKTTTTFKLRLDRFIGEVEPDSPRRAKAHLISVIGGDTQIAAMNAAISTDESFEVEGPDVDRISVSLGRNAQTYRASLQLADRKRPLRHLIGISEELLNNVGSTGRTILANSDSTFLWMSLARIHGLPAVPEWADWFSKRLETQKSTVSLLGIGCSPVMVKGDKKTFLRWLGQGVQRGLVAFPTTPGRIAWPRVSLADIFTLNDIERS